MALLTLDIPPAKLPRHIKRVRIWYRRFRDPLLTLLLVIQVFSLFVVPSIRAAGFPVPHYAVYGVLLVFVTLAIFLARSRTAMVMMIISVILAIVGIILHTEHPDLKTELVTAIGQVLTQVSLIWVISTAVFGRGPTSHHRILGAVVMYLAIGMIFTSLYILLAETLPGAFTHLVMTSNFEVREDLTYYSFGTLTTGTFGDISPVHPIARSLSNLESICGQLFPATLLARIVSLHVSSIENRT